jgi:L-lactate dehydrogenase complex protein LldG
MGSREAILSKIQENKPELLDLPIIDSTVFDEDLDLIKEFTKKVEVVGGNVFSATSNQDVVSQVEKMYENTAVNYSNLEGTNYFNTLSLEEIKNPKELEDLDVLILESDLAVAENGSVWLADEKLPMRVLPFITKHLVLVLAKNNLVGYMHEAYQKIDKTDFGVFISGPSKTADIEQSLVIGAHGALSLSVFIV